MAKLGSRESEPLGIGTIVLYAITGADAERARARRQIHHRQGNPIGHGDILPMIVCRIWPEEFGAGVVGVNGQVILDGEDTLWVTSVKEGDAPGMWRRRM